MTKLLLTGANMSSLTVRAATKFSSAPWILAITRSCLPATPPKWSRFASGVSWSMKYDGWQGWVTTNVQSSRSASSRATAAAGSRMIIVDPGRISLTMPTDTVLMITSGIVNTTTSLTGTTASAPTVAKPRALIAATPASEFSQKCRTTRSRCFTRLLVTRVPILPPAPMTLTTIFPLMPIAPSRSSECRRRSIRIPARTPTRTLRAGTFA